MGDGTRVEDFLKRCVKIGPIGVGPNLRKRMDILIDLRI